MRTYSEEAKSRIGEMNTIRAYYDVTALFEMGYVVSELLERYRKMVLQIKGPYEERENSPGVAFATKRCEYVQKLFFEIFQLCNMVHEIEKKWSESLIRERKRITGEDGEGIDGEERRKRIEAAIANSRAARLKEIKKRRKWRKQKDKFGLIANVQGNKDRRPKNKWWPLDYGWEIDYYW
ncbi:unnamed protein product [Pieris macdunnoughi]|uniref:Uncharacterized protein n=1 Tax=Pieris macdunnoughi TaxID=345717 RepID=A0A821XHC0_9NEOP|nr:unnamed protein product [Pieris macdunnoughi]